MVHQTPFNYEFHKFLRQVVGVAPADRHLYVATESDFQKAGNITFPYRSYFYALGLMHEDRCRIRVGIQDFDVPKQALTVIGPGITRLWLENNWAVRNTTLFFTPDLFSAPFSSSFLLSYPFFGSGAQHVIVLSDEQYARANAFIALIQQYVAMPKIAAGLLFSFLEYLLGIYPDSANSVLPGMSNRLVRQFSQLLHTHFQEQKEVGFYADQLNVSARHLSELLKQETGKSAKQSIEDFVLFEARSLLKQTDLSIKEIVYWLGYDDPSYFTRLFRSKTGCTPMEYRA
ncbi:AraC family transcriptional regulator [Fibrisoma montanum]|uniref:AraC family transcriptional regulator n=1 Tax=Fibrisoma montanum TaxID=2305895 RepID=A0A418LWX2_9BACT|nr:AraC family transcriptional regulator [Fibrisoma montanum]RIV17849.1 AraC family transcriptional regulator [Fibrisoma montanum]